MRVSVRSKRLKESTDQLPQARPASSQIGLTPGGLWNFGPTSEAPTIVRRSRTTKDEHIQGDS